VVCVFRASRRGLCVQPDREVAVAAAASGVGLVPSRYGS
jgi:hypothetical protein